VQDAEDVGDNVMLDLADLHVPPDDVYEVWDGRGQLLGRSPNWRAAPACPCLTTTVCFEQQLAIVDYGLLLIRGTRIVDPGEAGGGHLRYVTILYGAPTQRVWQAIYGAVEFYAAGMLPSRSHHRTADRMGASSRTRAAAPPCVNGRTRFGRLMGILSARLRA